MSSAASISATSGSRSVSSVDHSVSGGADTVRVNQGSSEPTNVCDFCRDPLVNGDDTTKFHFGDGTDALRCAENSCHATFFNFPPSERKPITEIEYGSIDETGTFKNELGASFRPGESWTREQHNQGMEAFMIESDHSLEDLRDSMTAILGASKGLSEARATSRHDTADSYGEGCVFGPASPANPDGKSRATEAESSGGASDSK